MPPVTLGQILIREAVGSRASLYILGCALGARILFLWSTSAFDQQPSSELLNVARSLVQSGSFADPYAAATGPTAHVPPAYPLILAALSTVAGAEAGWAARILNLLCASALWALMPFVAERLRLPRAVGALAGHLGALHFARLAAEVDSASDAPFSAVAGLGLLLWTLSLAGTRPGIRVAAAYGAAAGGLVLLQPSFLPAIAGFVGYLTWKWRAHGYAGAPRFPAVALGLLLVTLTPWLARNYVVLGGLVPVRDNLPLELFLSNNPGASPLHWVNQSGIANELHPYANAAQAARVREMGELAYQREMRSRFLDWIGVYNRLMF